MNFIVRLDRKLAGQPDEVLTLFLIIAGIIAWIVAIWGNPTLKALILAWIVLP